MGPKEIEDIIKDWVEQTLPDILKSPNPEKQSRLQDNLNLKKFLLGLGIVMHILKKNDLTF